jgi:hypothetical protein
VFKLKILDWIGNLLKPKKITIELGILSKKYESSGDPGAINHHDGPNDAGSYGAYQFYSGAGVVQAFIEWMIGNNTYNDMGKQFDGLTAATDEFNAKWEEIAKNNYDLFLQAQYDYARIMYFDIAVVQLAKISFASKSQTMQNVIWSCAVQYSPYKVPKLFNEAAQWIGYDECTKVDDERLLIAAIYFMRSTDEWNKSIRRMCYRMALECTDAMEMLKSES